METPVVVIGWKDWKNEETGKEGMLVFGTRKLIGEGTYEGQEAVRIFFNKKYVDYVPKVGDQIIAVEGRYGIDRIVVLNSAV